MLEMKQDNLIRDRIIAAMETGNHSQARTLLNELQYLHEELYRDIKMDVTAEYGISL